MAAAIRAAAEEVGNIMTHEIKDETPARLTSTAMVATPKAAQYGAQLAKHFAHKIPARFEEGRGEIAFPAGTCALAAEDDALTMTVSAATPEGIARLEEVVASHLLRFAFRDELAIEWRRD